MLKFKDHCTLVDSQFVELVFKQLYDKKITRKEAEKLIEDEFYYKLRIAQKYLKILEKSA